MTHTTSAEGFLGPNLMAHNLFELLPAAYRNFGWNNRGKTESSLDGNVILPVAWDEWTEKHIHNIVRLAPEDQQVKMELRVAQFEQSKKGTQQRQVGSVSQKGGKGSRGGKGGSVTRLSDGRVAPWATRSYGSRRRTQRPQVSVLEEGADCGCN